MSKGKDQDLKDLQEALTLTLHALLLPPPPPTSPSSSSSSSSSSPPLPPSTLSSDFLSLLHLLKSHTTTLSLSLGKPPPTPHAALPSLLKISTDFQRVQFLVSSLSLTSHVLLVKEWGWCRDELKEALVALVKGFQTDLFGSKEGVNGRKGGWEKEYLGRVGQVYSVVERAVDKKNGLSKSEREAIGKKWRSEGEGLVDGEREAKEIVEEEDDEDSEGEDENEEEEEEEDDGWEGLMGGKSIKKSSEEKQVVKKLSPLLRLPHLLHSHLLTHHLPQPTSLAHLHSLLPLSTALLSAQDDLVSSLYASPFPAPAELQELVDELVEAMRGLKRAVQVELEGRKEEDGVEKVEKRLRWLVVWEAMVEKVGREVKEGLDAFGTGTGTEELEEKVGGLKV
ncbi:hypothetical protein BDY24DRAFT_388270 [Mrakia frigida]|uniref:uncharacterized protein n=1 Tax=Mrakia frigida TaxID=29902 RepID=UPI003FCC1C28